MSIIFLWILLVVGRLIFMSRLIILVKVWWIIFMLILVFLFRKFGSLLMNGIIIYVRENVIFIFERCLLRILLRNWRIKKKFLMFNWSFVRDNWMSVIDVKKRLKLNVRNNERNWIVWRNDGGLSLKYWKRILKWSGISFI